MQKRYCQKPKNPAPKCYKDYLVFALKTQQITKEEYKISIKAMRSRIIKKYC